MPADHEDDVQEIVGLWMRQARSDLSVAQMIDNLEIAPEILAFHAQQAAEKSLKALLIRRQIEYPRTHILSVLINLCEEAGFRTESIPEDAMALSQYAVAARYPGEAPPINRKEARLAADAAMHVFLWAEAQIQNLE